MKEFYPFRIDLDHQRLWRIRRPGPDEQVELAPKAFELLCYLAAHSGRLVTHAELLEALWPGVHVQPEVIKVQILALRQALGDDVKSPRFIETYRGRGYGFIAPVRSGGASFPAPPSAHRGAILVGRAGPLEDLRNCSSEALDGRLQVVFVVGEPGIGKTALLEQFVNDSAVDSRFTIARGQCVEGFGGTEPYYPVLEALGGLRKSKLGGLVTRDLQSFAPSWATELTVQAPGQRDLAVRHDVAATGRERMLREICDFLDELSQAHPVLLIFEDLHWADYSTIDLLSALARRRASAKLMIIATYRPEDAAAGRHPVKALNHALALRKLCREIVLEPLALGSVNDFLTGSHSDGSKLDGFAGLLLAQTGGNPLFMNATLDDLTERGLVEWSGGECRLRTSLDKLDLAVPLTLAQVIEARIQRLSDTQRDCLEAAAIAGVSFIASQGAAASRKTPESFEKVCEELCRHELFIDRQDKVTPSFDAAQAQYHFRHALYRQIFYNRQGPLRRQQAHRRIGACLEAAHPAEQRHAVASELAQHFEAAGEWRQAVHYLRSGLQTTKKRFANQEALDILARIEMLAARLPAAERTSVTLELLEARAATYSVEHDQRAVDTYEQLANAAEAHADFDVAARALLGLAYAVSWRDGAKALANINHALDISDTRLTGVSQACVQVSGHAWRIWISGWNHNDAQKCEHAFFRLQSSGDQAAAAWGALEFSLVAFLSTRYEQAKHGVTTGYQALHKSPGTRPEFSLERAVWTYFFGMPIGHFLLGELGESLRAFDEGILLFTRTRNQYAVAILRLYRAWLHYSCFDYEGVIAECQNILGLDQSEDVQNISVTSSHAEYRLGLLLIGLAEIGLGRIAEGQDHLSIVARLIETKPVIFDWYWRLLLERGLAIAAMISNNPAKARAHAATFTTLAMRTPERTWQALAWETRARVALHEADQQKALQCVGRALEAVAVANVPLAEPHVFAAAAKTFQAVGDNAKALEYSSLAQRSRAKLRASLPENSQLRLCLSSPAI